MLDQLKRFFRSPALSPRQEDGHAAEEQARLYLESRGYRFLAANHRERFGEVDLVMEEGDTVVFVEVRRRRSRGHGSAVESVTRKKQERVVKAALAFAKARGLARRPLRFDVVGIEPGRLDHIPHAFVPSPGRYSL